MTGAIVVVSLLLGVSGLIGCQSASSGAVGSRQFGTRNEIVPAISAMLRDRDWASLAQYYDLRNSKVSVEQLTSGDYFYDTSPDAAPPGQEFRRYRHPFAPGARLNHQMDGVELDVVVLVMVLELPPGSNPPGPLVYRFRIKRHGWGWRILPVDAR